MAQGIRRRDSSDAEHYLEYGEPEDVDINTANVKDYPGRTCRRQGG